MTLRSMLSQQYYQEHLHRATTFSHYLILLYITYWQYLSTLSALSRVSLVSMLGILTRILVMMSLLPMCTQVIVNVMGTLVSKLTVNIETMWKLTKLHTSSSSDQHLSGVFSCKSKYWSLSKYPSEFQNAHTSIHDKVDHQTNMIYLPSQENMTISIPSCLDKEKIKKMLHKSISIYSTRGSVCNMQQDVSIFFPWILGQN